MTDEILDAVRAEASPELVDAIDIALLTGRRPADVLKFRRDIISDAFRLRKHWRPRSTQSSRGQ